MKTVNIKKWLCLVISDRVDFKTRNLIEDKDRYLMIKILLTYQKGIKIIDCMFLVTKLLNTGSKKLTELKGSVNKSTNC